MSIVFLCASASSPTFPFFFFNDTATTEIYTLSLHDALPISASTSPPPQSSAGMTSSSHQCSVSLGSPQPSRASSWLPLRSEEHTSELQSRSDLVCRLLLEKKKTNFFAVFVMLLCVALPSS